MAISKTLAGIVLSLFSLTPAAMAQQGRHHVPHEYHTDAIADVGTFELKDVSAEFIHRLNGCSPLCAGLEYTFIDRSIDKNDIMPQAYRHSVMGSVGVFNDQAALLLKSGAFFRDGRAYWNYGAEILKTFGRYGKIVPVGGFSWTNENIQIKLGINF